MPAKSIISKFGGQCALARILNKRQSTIQGWAQRGRIPFLAIPLVRQAALEHLGIDLPVEAFMPTTDGPESETKQESAA